MGGGGFGKVEKNVPISTCLILNTYEVKLFESPDLTPLDF